MKKTIKVSLNKFPAIPISLLSTAGAQIGEIEVDLARLYHHHYLDTRGTEPPNPDPTQFQHLSLLLPTSDFRVRGDGFGTHSAYRQHVSNELGQAFCRWFLDEYLNVTYFAHMEHVLNRGSQPDFGGARVERVKSGDTPDYLCARDRNSVSLAEAKGRVASISFTNAKFKEWREQFDRVIVKDSGGTPRSVKGYIVATRFAMESAPYVNSQIFAEDPESQGEGALRDDPSLGDMVIALHYSTIAAKLRQPILSAALETGVRVSEEIQFPATVWEILLPPYEKKRFVGGYFAGPDGVAPVQIKNGNLHFLPVDPLRIDFAPGTFFGVEESVFQAICAMARSRETGVIDLNPIPRPVFFYSAISYLRDGSIIGPVDFFRPLQRIAY
jgi:hypothetical protein